ncbi:uridine nucleosidase [Nannizzia gypsea CBS 118893]|uniref:Uridine nucleosidase n=1 Tax=Arthroderma gypseum (strain ATCC MYA-4604 / CBS 118893) TaxID=535722 RepID=E5QYG1_ARTGP|nr:uridine nucleosidase [Nannizzia gypsea CBS 118893]EFQ98037.1 uridine nucleosidase [Nannizzia gypsea CBS 118893]
MGSISVSGDGRIPLWLDCDPGHDDAFAILLATHHPSLKLLGISTVHGNGSLENTTANAGSILEAIGRSDIPVYPGAKKPFCRKAVHAENIHGTSGIDGTDLLPAPTKPAVTNVSAYIAMRDALLAQPKDTAWVVATGTLTNVAILFATFPEVAEHVRGVSIMGGAVGGGFSSVPISQKQGDETRVGNITPWAEFNIYCDPESAQSIFSSPVLAPKTTLVTVDLTHQVLATEAVQSRILGTNGPAGGKQDPTVLRQILHALLTFFAGTYDTVFGISAGPPLHDPLAVAILLSNLNDQAKTAASLKEQLTFDDANGTRFNVFIDTDGLHHCVEGANLQSEIGRTIVQPCPAGTRGVTIPQSLDVDKFWETIYDCLDRADKWNLERTRMA